MNRTRLQGVVRAPVDRRRIDNLLGALVLTTHDRVSATFRKLDLRTASDAATLILILNSGALSIGALAKILNLSHSSMVRVADRLARRGLVTRSRDDKDAREVVLNLTRKGEPLAIRAVAARAAVLAEIGDALSPTETLALGALLEKLLTQSTTGRASADQICRMCDEAICMTGTCPVEQVAVETGAP